jgi:hypothetical protein
VNRPQWPIAVLLAVAAASVAAALAAGEPQAAPQPPPAPPFIAHLAGEFTRRAPFERQHAASKSKSRLGDLAG